MTLKNVFAVFEILADFYLERRFTETLESFHQKESFHQRGR